LVDFVRGVLLLPEVDGLGVFAAAALVATIVGLTLYYEYILPGTMRDVKAYDKESRFHVNATRYRTVWGKHGN